jgi:carbonic anhydrase
VAQAKPTFPLACPRRQWDVGPVHETARAFAYEVVKTNVRQTIDNIRRQSSVLSGLKKDGKIKIVGSMYHLIGGRVEFLT